jgi:hypothetical protein
VRFEVGIEVRTGGLGAGNPVGKVPTVNHRLPVMTPNITLHQNSALSKHYMVCCWK